MSLFLSLLIENWLLSALLLHQHGGPPPHLIPMRNNSQMNETNDAVIMPNCWTQRAWAAWGVGGGMTFVWVSTLGQLHAIPDGSLVIFWSWHLENINTRTIFPPLSSSAATSAEATQTYFKENIKQISCWFLYSFFFLSIASCPQNNINLVNKSVILWQTGRQSGRQETLRVANLIRIKSRSKIYAWLMSRT